MKPLSPDTTVEAQRKHYELMRRFIARVLPRTEVIRVYGFDPQAEGF